jgi:hypothetical protein
MYGIPNNQLLYNEAHLALCVIILNAAVVFEQFN